MADDGPPLRIIHCFRSPVGGVFRHVRDLIEEHVKQGHKVGIVCDSSTGGAHEERLFAQIAPMLELGLTRLPIKRSISPGDLWALVKSYNHIKSLRPDILHGHSAKGGALARLIGSLLRVNKYRVARLYSPHGGSLHYDRKSLKGQLFLRIERFQEHFTDALCFVCNFEQETYETKVGKPRTRTAMIYNGVQESEFETVPTREGAARFLYIGMLRDLKGPDIFIKAFAKMERSIGQPMSGVIVGDGPDRDKYADMIAKAGLSQRISMHAAMPARQAFALATTVVVPSRAEAMPYIVLEALAAGKTVIASHVGGIAEVLGEDSEALVPAGDADALAKIMVKDAESPDWGKRVMPRPDSFKAKFSTPVMADDMMKLYRHLLSL
ncbi:MULTISPECIES: polysaccharide biosynthesis type 4 glycosyltransferase UppD [Rhizobium/Agrobacterium group]|jgi:glycosyltransferase involved in cell wall biosynthesis|uniref:polysaccharide biosynthesis type 4 glycosyltransferase UppD n=1 Tax=Rhizobium/Agrobacterium group TaxID=227290 RepID=UPI0003F1CB8E|nr:MULTISPECIES: polysaccharide biosynthesis type 4 glycosyltransferase UppD [Rhizobium/Agrobacterium group]AHK01111.1 glycosyltransferase [Agrobacterium tumefaciens LBA4213 (Ach5)]AKC06922.1 glycosyl transferase [Agrobacterium tumefaciens]AYM15828.1 glycosyl transferase [Agrobacterium tumefaciens]AYM67063.1 glycosyl transferase [Agrobacterium tumefaciens]NIB54659.1 glycosyltransferase family 4 protein [Agrobacterium tumefaciens]